jgi:hypothetical protein
MRFRLREPTCMESFAAKMTVSCMRTSFWSAATALAWTPRARRSPSDWAASETRRTSTKTSSVYSPSTSSRTQRPSRTSTLISTAPTLSKRTNFPSSYPLCTQMIPNHPWPNPLSFIVLTRLKDFPR